MIIRFYLILLINLLIWTNSIGQVSLYSNGKDSVFCKNSSGIVLDTLIKGDIMNTFYWNNKFYGVIYHSIVIRNYRTWFTIFSRNIFEEWIAVEEFLINNNNEIVTKYCFDIDLYDCIAEDCIDSFRLAFNQQGFEWHIHKEGNHYTDTIPREKFEHYFIGRNSIAFPKEICCRKKYLNPARKYRKIIKPLDRYHLK